MSKFAELKAKLSKRKGVTSPGGLAYAIGERKFGKARMAKAAAEHKPAASVK